MDNAVAFTVATPLGFTVSVSKSYWELIVTVKHPNMRSREVEVQQALQMPEQIRRSRHDGDVYLFYLVERVGRWICAVARRLNGDGFLVTAYVTDAIKEGDLIWSM